MSTADPGFQSLWKTNILRTNTVLLYLLNNQHLYKHTWNSPAIVLKRSLFSQPHRETLGTAYAMKPRCRKWFFFSFAKYWQILIPCLLSILRSSQEVETNQREKTVLLSGAKWIQGSALKSKTLASPIHVALLSVALTGSPDIMVVFFVCHFECLLRR